MCVSNVCMAGESTACIMCRLQVHMYVHTLVVRSLLVPMVLW